MSFRTQRLANSFPLWSKLRRDSSSTGQKLFSVFAELTAEQTINAVKLSEDLHLLKNYLGVGSISSVVLDDDDLFPSSTTSPGVRKFTYPVVQGTLGADVYTLERQEDIITFLNTPPTRLVAQGDGAYTSHIVWESTSPYTYSELPWPERIYISVEDSTFYARRSKVQDREYTGRHVVQIAGTDENNIPIREYVEIRDDGYFRTRNIFKTVSEVISEGFDGTCTLRWFPDQQGWRVDPYRQAVFDDFEGQLRLSIAQKVIDSVTYSYVEYSSSRLKLGQQYRRKEIEAPSNTEILAEVVLLNASGNPYTAVDLAINYQTSRLYVLDDQGSVHVYDHELSPFENIASDVETTRTYMELIPLRHYAKFGDTEYLYTDFARNRFGINKIEVKRTSPSGVVEYLQTDKTSWAGAQAFIASKTPDERMPEDTWQDFRFQTKYDELGQWEYALTTHTFQDVTVFVTSVMVSKLTALSSLDTGVASTQSLAFSKEDYIAVTDGSRVYWFSEASDTWLADVRLGQVLMRSQYDQVEVTY